MKKQKKHRFLSFFASFVSFCFLGAFIGFVLFMYSSVYLIIDNEWFANVEVYIDSAELIVKCIFCMLPVLFYALSYVALRRRQVKW